MECNVKLSPNGAAAPTCSTATATDRAKIAWVANAVTGETTSYTYDTNNRLTQAAVTGGPTRAPTATPTMRPATGSPAR